MVREVREKTSFSDLICSSISPIFLWEECPCKSSIHRSISPRDDLDLDSRSTRDRPTRTLVALRCASAEGCAETNDWKKSGDPVLGEGR